ncbi:MAG: RNA polymerase factor sigma-54 [Alphaproteobacteria bacterium]
MPVTPRLDLRQTQALVMTPQLQQAIKLLQLSNLELTEYVERELEENPLLEHDEGDNVVAADEPGGSDAEPETGLDDESSPALDSKDFADSETLPNGQDAPLDADFENLWESGPESAGDGAQAAFAKWGTGGRLDFTESHADVEQTPGREKSLRDHLLDQLNVDIHDPADRVIGTHLIDMVDEAGYLSGDLATVAERLSCGLERVEATLERLQRFDPPGIMARNLAECLALQLKDRDRLDPAMQALLDHLDILARHDLRGLMRVCGVDAEDLAEMVAEIRSLDPKPALAFDHTVAQTITPDILMQTTPKGGWMMELNSDTLPRVLVNTRYYAEVSRGVRNKAEKEYISQCFQSANWLVKSLHQRATTILKVAREIVRQQDAFFRHGVQHLRPLILRDIAAAIDMHESTVSRVTSNKYMATPRGTYELKYFFTSAIAGAAGGETHSAEAVRHRIRALIDQESATDVLSDDRIVEILRAEGVEIARRTIAKYREAMRIPSSIERRRQKTGGI